MHRTVSAAARDGIDQFLDVGTGIPTAPNLHQIAQSIQPAANVLYVDNDPIVLAHAAALLTSEGPGRVSYLQADARSPGSILHSEDLLATLDTTRPVSVSVIGILHFLADDQATRLVRTLMDAFPAGSRLTFSHATLDHDDDGGVRHAVDSYVQAGIPAWARSLEQVRTLLLDGLDVLEPGVVATPQWRPDPEAARFDIPDRSQWAAVARKP